MTREIAPGAIKPVAPPSSVINRVSQDQAGDIWQGIAARWGRECQRRSKTASACRIKNTSVMLARRVPELGAFSSDIMLGSDYPPACPSWHGVSCAFSD